MKKKLRNAQYVPKKCWVGNKNKICYASRDEAEMAARYQEYVHGLAKDSLQAYHCDYGNHWHLANKK